jgi:L-lactate dehydrogenase complex protein LldE
MMRETTLVIPCMINHFFPHLGEKWVKIMEYLGYKVIIHENQTCCGYPYIQNGEMENAKKVAEKFLYDFQTGRHEHKTLMCSSVCFSSVNKIYPKLFHNSVSHNLCQKVIENIAHFYGQLGSRKIKIVPKEKMLLVLDCMSDHSQIEAITGFNDTDSNWVLMHKGYFCCGANNALALNNVEESKFRIQSILDFAKEKEVKVIVFSDDNCLLHGFQNISTNNSKIKIAHLIDILYDQITEKN